MEQINLSKKIAKKYGLADKDKITSKLFFEISSEEKIELYDLILILGINKNNKKKLKEQKECKMQINLKPIQIKTIEDVKNVIKMIRIDLKYLEEYKERYYTKKEIEDICEKYNIKFIWFIKYIFPRKRNYYENLEILEKSKNGLWIGNNRNIDDEFLLKNYQKIEKTCNYIAKDICKFYNCDWLKEQVQFEAFISILENGLTQKNLEYDNNYMFNKLKYKAKFKALKFTFDKFKERSYEQIMENDFITKDNLLLLDNNYNPFEMIGNKLELQDSEMDYRHNHIIKKIIKKIYLNESRDYILRKTAKELQLQKHVLGVYLEQIQKSMICNGKVKVCKNGQVIIMNNPE